MKKLIDKTVLRFAIVGVINTVVGAGAMFLLYNCCGVGYWIASASNYVIGSLVSFFLNKYYTFNSKGGSFKEIAIFAINIAVCYFLAYSVAKPLVYRIFSGINNTHQDNIALFVGMCIFVVLNYFGQRFIVFKYDKK